jgi:hypothetical protein
VESPKASGSSESDDDKEKTRELEADKAQHERAEKDRAEKDKAERERVEKEAEKEREKIRKRQEQEEKDRENAGKRKHDQEEKEKVDKERRTKDIAKLGPLPSATFDRGFRGALYGKLNLDNFVHEAPSTTLYSGTTNLTFEITAHDGVLSIGPAQGNAWHVRVVPLGIPWNSETARLFKGSAFVSVRSEGVEIGAQVRLDSSSEFFVLANGGPLILRFEVLLLLSFLFFLFIYLCRLLE